MDLDKIKTLIDFVGQSRISQLSVTDSGTTVRISHYAHPQNAAVIASDVVPDSIVNAIPESLITIEQAADTVRAPTFGVFHRAPHPGEKPFVDIGDEVESGQSLFIVEAMKVFNTVTTDRAGKIVRVLVEDGQEVDAGQPVLEIAL
ncbi:acetyl-CoA carboxylase biotin carboxyl carrier protein [Agrobacterium vitis]